MISNGRDLYIDGVAMLMTFMLTTADINGGTIDNVNIGGNRSVNMIY